MKTLLQALLLFTTMLSCQGAEPSAATNDWSAPVNGLRARIIFGDAPVGNGIRVPKIYLELQNISDVGNPMEFSFDAGKSIRFELREAGGQPIPQSSAMVSGFSFGAFPIALPMDGTIRFPITWNGHYPMQRDGGTALGFQGGFWFIPRDATKVHFLSATIEIPETPSAPSGGPRWHGTIAIPSVRVPLQK